MTASPPSAVTLSATPAMIVGAADSPWVPMSEGQSFRLLKILPGYAGYVAQLKLVPGTVIPPHRHTGTVHALNLQGSRKLHSGEIINPGDYVFEPAGNTDSWMAIGNEPLVVHIQVEGDVEYLDGDGGVAVRYNAAVMEAAHRRYCEATARTAGYLGAAT